MSIAFHPASEIFPLLDGKPLAELAADIRENGLREAIILHLDGSIIDGRNRYRACEAAGVKAQFSTWDGKGSLTALVMSLNLHRRHMDPSQRAMVAAKAKPLFEAEAKQRHGLSNSNRANLPPSSTGKARDKAAEAAGVSGRSVEHASTVLRDGGPELVKAVESGKTSVSAAAKSVRASVNRAVDEERKRLGIEKLPTPKRAREIALATGKSVPASNNKLIHPISEAEARRRSDEQYAVLSHYDAIELLATPKFSPDQLITLRGRYINDRLPERAMAASKWLERLIEGLNANRQISKKQAG